jgi:hypothetical protein
LRKKIFFFFYSYSFASAPNARVVRIFDIASYAIPVDIDNCACACRESLRNKDPNNVPPAIILGITRLAKVANVGEIQ